MTTLKPIFKNKLSQLFHGDTLEVMQTLKDESFDLIFADPPYDFEEEQFLKIVDLVFSQNILKEEGVLIIEHSKHTDLSKHENHIYDKRYGGNVFSFFENQEI